MNDLATLRADYTNHRDAIVARGWTASQFRAVVDSVVVEQTPAGYVEAARTTTAAFTAASHSGALPVAIEGSVKLTAFDCFSRAWNANRTRRFSEKNKRSARIYLPVGSDVLTVLANLRSCSVGIGTSETGTYEVQSDAGIWKQFRSMAIQASDVGTKRLIFLSWEQMEAIELAGGEPFAEVVEAVA